jgi:hypothetical protein
MMARVPCTHCAAASCSKTAGNGLTDPRTKNVFTYVINQV